MLELYTMLCIKTTFSDCAPFAGQISFTSADFPKTVESRDVMRPASPYFSDDLQKEKVLCLSFRADK